MAVSPILPTSFADPTGLNKVERGAMNEFARRIRIIRKYYIDRLNEIPYDVIQVNMMAVNETRYAYRLDPAVLRAMYADFDSFIDEILASGGEQNWFFNGYVNTAYQRGTAQSFANLAAQSPVYKAAQGSLREILMSAPYQDRIALVRARVFEEMKNLTGNIKANMGRVLADGIGRGLNPRDIAKNLTEQTGIAQRRANLIARTEISTALRRARWDEKDYAAENYGIKSLMMHISAFKNTSRPNHIARHGKLYSTGEMRDFYSTAKESCNCLCSAVEVLVDDNDKPLVPAIVERAKRNKEVAEARLAAEE